MSHEHTHEHGHDHDHDHDGCGIPKFHVRDLIIREDIMAKAKELAELITTSDEVDFYRRAEMQIQDNTAVQDLIKLIKKRQKEAVAFENTFKNPQMVEKINQEIDELQDRLDEIPIVGQFKQAQDDLNYLLQLIVNVVRDTVSDKINVENGTVEVHTGGCND
jgi:cell fate (sporulation/competence/biofilm development) regulator YmcA (YheA/YmcA/DUF963 family)